jgi:iron complex transport system ATP-binding protein
LTLDRPACPVLRVTGVTVTRGRAALLSDVDWTVWPDERWVVLGSNGAGKTTLLRVVSGTRVPNAGRVELLGESLDAADLDDLLPRVGLASAALDDELPRRERALDVVLTACYAQVGRGGETYEAEDELRARVLLAQVGCRGLAERRYGSLSEGERKRVQIARALMADPELLLLDEPAAGLDLAGREALLRLLSRLATDPASPATVFVTHHVEDIPTGFTHALLLRAGAVVDAGPIDEVISASGLSACFGLPLALERHGGRFAARAALTLA